MTNIKNIIFDVGGVLADPKSGNWFITNNFYNIVDKKYINETILKLSLRNNLYMHTQEPKTEEEEYKMFSDYYYKVLSDIKYPNVTREISNKIAEDCVYNDDKFIFYDDVINNLKRLSNNYNLYIISNGWPSSIRVLHNKEIDIYFKGIMISSMYSTTKEEALFDLFIKEYKVNPKESLFIDDRTHILKKANEYGFNLLQMNRKNILMITNFKVINSLDKIEEK